MKLVSSTQISINDAKCLKGTIGLRVYEYRSISITLAAISSKQLYLYSYQISMKYTFQARQRQ